MDFIAGEFGQQAGYPQPDGTAKLLYYGGTLLKGDIIEIEIKHPDVTEVTVFYDYPFIVTVETFMLLSPYTIEKGKTTNIDIHPKADNGSILKSDKQFPKL